MPNFLGSTFGKIFWAGSSLALAAFSAGTSIKFAERRGEAGPLTGMYADEGVVQMRAEQRALSVDPNHKLRQSSVDAVRLTLRSMPLNASALSLLGASAAGPTDTGLKADHFMRIAERVTRRDPLSQIWALEASSAAGDVQGAVAHYNALLSTNPGLSEVLFRVLTPALDFPEIQTALRPYLMRQAIWMPAFVAFAAENGKVDSLLGMIGQSYASLRPKPYAPANSVIVWRLAKDGRSDQAIAIAQQVFVGFDGQKFRQFGVSAATTDLRLGQLSWKLGGQPGLDASLEENGDVTISVEPIARADVLSRSIFVKPGAGLAFSYALSSEDNSRSAGFKWIITCMNTPVKGTTLAPWAQDAVVGPETKFETVKFPGFPGCNLLNVELMALGSEGQVGSVAKLSILPISQ